MHKYTKLILAIASLTLLVGCSGTSDPDMIHPSKSQSAVDLDNKQCYYEIKVATANRKSTMGAVMNNRLADRDMYRMCMEARGYTVAK